jgi:tRNA G37 N-methylase Trm5
MKKLNGNKKKKKTINKLLQDNGIFDSQHLVYEGKIQLMFLKELEVEGKKIKVGIKIKIPEVTEINKNQLYRALFYYLKAKFESLTFGFVEEYNEAFVKEFMPYIVADKQGKTISDLILPKLNNSLGITKQGEQLYLENKENHTIKDGLDADYSIVEEKQK